MLKVLYLTPVGIRKGGLNGDQRRLKLVEEDLSDVLTNKRCLAYLMCFYPQQHWTDKDVDRCFNVFYTLIQRQLEWDKDYFYDPYFPQYGVFIRSLRAVLDEMFKTDVRVCSYLGAGWKQEYAIARFGPAAIGKPTSLADIIKDDKEYDTFLGFWSKIPTVRQTQQVLCQLFPKDVANIILEFF